MPEKEKPAVLIIDDDEFQRQLLTEHLAWRGMDLETAASGREAVDILERRPFDVVLLDVAMPGMSGGELLTILRERFAPTELPIIVISGIDDPAKIVVMLDLGANDYLVKPPSYDVLSARIRRQVATKRAFDAMRRPAQAPE